MPPQMKNYQWKRNGPAFHLIGRNIFFSRYDALSGVIRERI
jgi:hypothetical protein